MSFTEEVSDAPISITGEMWVCADSTGPSKVGAGRGLKNFITIEKDLFCAYSSRSAQSKQTKQVAFRSMKRVAWFTHRPTPPVRGSSASTTTAALRRRGSKDVLTVYYYLVLEFLRDNTCPGTVSLGKRERIVLCTDDQQDFLIWRKFADLYGSSLVHEGLVEGREKRSLKSQRNADGVPDHDDTTSSDDDGEGHGLSCGAVCRRSLDLWKNRCVALLNDFAHLSNPSLQVKSADIFEAPADCGGLSWDAHAESVLHAIEQGMHPLMKVVPAKSSEDRIVGLSSLLSSPSTTPASILPGASATAAMVTHVDEMQSQADNLRMELRRFQEVTGEVGSLVEGSKLKATMMSPDTLHAYLERLRKVLTSSEPANNVATQRVDKTVTKTSVASADLAKLEGVCKAAVRSFTEKVSTNALPLSEESNRQKAKQQEQEELPQRMETVVAVLLDELARATADVRSLKASLAQSTALTEPSPARNLSVELNELRRVLNRKELEVETLQQQNFDANRQTKQLSRRLEEVVFSYGEVAHDMLRSQYREYASLRSLFLPALCGEVPLDSSTATEASFAASSSFDGIREARPTSYSQVPSSGMQKLVISTAHLEAIQALEQERSAARERQRELEEVMKELEVLRQERDEEIANLKYNFLAAEEAWERDMAILQAKLSAVQSAVPQGVDLLSNALLTNNTTEKSGIAQKLTSTPLHDTAAPVDVPESPLIVAQMAVKRQERLKELATLLGTTPSETSLEDDVAYQRLQDFYTWAREVVAPLSTTSSFEGSLLDMITSIVHAYQAVLQQASTIYTDATSSKDDSSLNLADIMKNEHDQLEKLWKIIDEHLLTQELRNALVSSTPQPLEERAALSFSSPPTVAELDQLPPLIQHVSSNAALYFQLQLRSGEIPLALYIQHLENKLEQLEQTLQQNDVQQKIIEDRSATHQPLPQNTSPHNDPIHLRGSLPDVEASPSEPCGTVIARAAAGAAERERVLRADLAAAEERQQAVESRLEAARTEQERVEADREELREGVADALAALGVEASPSEPCGAVIARAAAGAAERERVLRADLAAAEERQQAVESRLEAARTEQERVEADREEVLQLRHVASCEDALACATEERDALIRTVGVCCESLCSAISSTTLGKPSFRPGTATILTCDEATSALTDLTTLTSNILHKYAHTMRQALALLTPLVGVPSNTSTAASSVEVLAHVMEAVQILVEQMERCQLQVLLTRKPNEDDVKARDWRQDQFPALCERSEEGGLPLVDKHEAQATLEAKVAPPQPNWVSVAEVWTRPTEAVGPTVRARDGSGLQHADVAEVLPLMRQATLLGLSTTAQEALQSRLSVILGACERCTVRNCCVEATVARKSLEIDELLAAVRADEDSLEKIRALVNEGKQLNTTMDVACEARGQPVTQAEHVATREQEEEFDNGVREAVGLVSCVRAATGEAKRLGEEVMLAQCCIEDMQVRLNRAGERKAFHVEDDGVRLEAVGRACSLEEALHVVAADCLECAKRSLESKEACRRCEIVQDWAVMMAGVSVRLHAEVMILQSRVVDLKAAVLESETRESSLLQRLNALLLSSGPLKTAVAAVAPSHKCDLESLEDVAIAMHAAAQLVRRQEGDIDKLLACSEKLKSDVDDLNDRLRGVLEERHVSKSSLVSLEETHGRLQCRMGKLERQVYDTFSTVERLTTAVLGEGESRRLDKGTPADCLDGIVYLSDVLVSRAEECDSVKAQLFAWKAEARDREESHLRTTASLSTLWKAFRTTLLPQLVDESADCRGGCGVAVASSDPVEFLPSESEARQAVEVVVDTADRLRCAHDDLQAVYAVLRGHFGGDAASAVTDGTGAPQASVLSLRDNSTTFRHFDDTVKATLRLVNTVVNAKCSSMRDFIDHVVSDVLRDTPGCSQISFAALRPGAFVEWLHGLLASLRTLRDSSDRHHNRARCLPAFMDALVETIHSYGGRVDVTSTGATDVLTSADATVPYRHDLAAVLEDWQAREQTAIVHGLQTLLRRQEERVRTLTAEWQDVTAQYQRLSQEQAAAEEMVMELRRRVQFKVQEDYKLEESLRELDSHLDQQARELAMKYCADQDAIVRRFTVLRDQIHATMRPTTQLTASVMLPQTPRRGTTTPHS